MTASLDRWLDLVSGQFGDEVGGEGGGPTDLLIG